jgi:hypothetical protein
MSAASCACTVACRFHASSLDRSTRHHRSGRQRFDLDARPGPAGDTAVDAHESPELVIDEYRHRGHRENVHRMQPLSQGLGEIAHHSDERRTRSERLVPPFEPRLAQADLLHRSRSDVPVDVRRRPLGQHRGRGVRARERAVVLEHVRPTRLRRSADTGKEGVEAFLELGAAQECRGGAYHRAQDRLIGGLTGG